MSNSEEIDVASLVELAEFERLALQLLPAPLRTHLLCEGADATLRANERAWRRWGLRSRALVDVSASDTSTTVLGQSIDLPVLIAPSAFQALCHPDAEVATARASASAGTIMVLSMAATNTPEDVGQAADQFWMQLYWTRDRGIVGDVVQRAAAAGATALCLTVDMPVFPYRSAPMRHSEALLGELTRLGTLRHFASESASRAQTVINNANYSSVADASITWSDLEWLRGLTPLPLVLKGIMRADDAKRAIEYGGSAVVVSNHGGIVLDQSLPTARVLPEVVEAVDGAIEVLVDGGIRTGADVLRALALGARAALIGRPVLWGLAVDGANGTARVLSVLREQLLVMMGMTGARSVADIDRSSIALHDSYDLSPPRAD